MSLKAERMMGDDDDVSNGGGEEDMSCSCSTSSPLQDMSSLLLQLPLKRGLSKHYNGKSQSFTSLSNVESLEDLPKQAENPFKKKLKTCQTYPRKHAASSHFNASFLQNHINNNNNSRPPIPPPYNSLIY